MTHLAVTIDLVLVAAAQREVPGPRVVGLNVEILLLGELHLDGAGVTEYVAAVEAGSGLSSGGDVLVLDQGVDHRPSLEHDDLLYLTCLSAHFLNGVHIQPVDGVQDGQQDYLVLLQPDDTT